MSPFSADLVLFCYRHSLCIVCYFQGLQRSFADGHNNSTGEDEKEANEVVCRAHLQLNCLAGYVLFTTSLTFLSWRGHRVT